MPYAMYQVTEDGLSLDGSWKPIATLTDDEMLAICRLRGLRFQLLMADDVGIALDKLSPAFYEIAYSRLPDGSVAETRLDRRLRELQGSTEPCRKEHDNAVGPVRD